LALLKLKIKTQSVKVKESSSYQCEKISGNFSKLLNREVGVNLLLPSNYTSTKEKFQLLILNDGQDIEKLGLKEILENLVQKNQIENIIVAGVIAGDRLEEYGVAAKKDYLKRGSKAKAYTKYLVSELIPELIHKYPIDKTRKFALAGYSMGALSAMDIAWNNPKLFNRVGSFSGAFWWRKRDSKSRLYSDARDRIIQQEIKNGKKKEDIKFWFQTGTEDEASDRNKNGVIDSIDDTLDLIVELTKKGYRPFHDIQYVEVKGGKHNLDTWAEAMPEFLKWAFGK
jgi:enterochelin esterase-like enzyme